MHTRRCFTLPCAVARPYAVRSQLRRRPLSAARAPTAVLALSWQFWSGGRRPMASKAPTRTAFRAATPPGKPAPIAARADCAPASNLTHWAVGLRHAVPARWIPLLAHSWRPWCTQAQLGFQPAYFGAGVDVGPYFCPNLHLPGVRHWSNGQQQGQPQTEKSCRRPMLPRCFAWHSPRPDDPPRQKTAPLPSTKTAPLPSTTAVCRAQNLQPPVTPPVSKMLQIRRVIAASCKRRGNEG